jgi:hypothetical protein
MEVSLRWKALYSWPPCTNLFKLACFYIENIMFLLYKQATLMRSTVLSLPPQLVFPGWAVPEMSNLVQTNPKSGSVPEES